MDNEFKGVFDKLRPMVDVENAFGLDMDRVVVD